MHPAYEPMVQFASEGQLKDELARAREEFIQRTGELFESDETYERRLASFLEWYVLDRSVSFAAGQTPADLYLTAIGQDEGLGENLDDVRRLTRTVPSLFEFKGVRKDTLRLVNLLTDEKISAIERRQLPGVESGDILESRLVPFEDGYILSETVTVLPRSARRTIKKGSKRLRKAAGDPVDFVHRVCFLSNRCDRYGHLNPKEIFADLVT